MSDKALCSIPTFEEQFRQIATIFDSMKVIVYVADLETFELLYVNEYTRGLFGRELVGRRCYEVLQRDQPRPCTFCTNDRLTKGGRALAPHVWEFQNTVTGRWFMCVDQAIRWTDGRLVRMEVAADITDRKQSDAVRQQLLSLISHDLRNPLFGLTASCQILQQKLADAGQKDLAEVADAAVAAAGRMDSLVEELIDMLRLHSGCLTLDRSTEDLVALVRRTAAAMDASRITVDAPAVAPPVFLDPVRWTRVLENLIGNALKYSPKGSPVEVKVEFGPREAVVTVVDRGPGISVADQGRLFTQFFRAANTQSTARGLGLGLFGARLIAEAHGGRIGVESEPGRGSRFHTTLPLESA